MAADFNKILENDAFKNIEKEKIEAIKQLAEEIQGKSMMEVMSIFSRYNAVLNSGNPITNEERNLMIHVIMESMDTEDKEKFKSVIKMIELMNK